jgi:apolipoprotein N-acyltransferase
MKEKPRLVLWPEAAVTVRGGFNFNWDNRFAIPSCSQVIQFLAQVDTYFLTGTISYEACDHPAGDRPKCVYNSAYLFAPRMEAIAGRYDKMHLVPFGEYVPLAKLFFFADAIAKGNTGSTTPGPAVKVMGHPGAPFGCVICYEVIFPELVRRFPREGAAFMTTITNDAWFGRTGAPFQHHANVVFRAVENRVFFVRAANTGISSIVDPNGRIIHATDIYVPASFTGTVRLSPLKTIYTRFGDLFALLDTAGLLAGLASAFIVSRKKTGTPPRAG